MPEPIDHAQQPTDPRQPQEPPKGAKKTPLEQLGGTTGLVYTALPIVAFVLGNSAFGLPGAIALAVAVALAICVLRLVRKEPLQPALGGLIGVAAASFVAWKSGSANGYFLTGIWSNIALCALFLVSLLVRRPLAGVVWGALNGTGTSWLQDKPSRRYYDIATLALVAVFAARSAVWQWLYEDDQTGWLGVARIVMGTPLLAVALLVVIWAGRRSGKRLKALAAQEQSVEAASPTR